MTRSAPASWSEALTRLRAALPAQREGGHQVGSLRWLEKEIERRGGRGATVRNIIYRDLGTAEDKRRLAALLDDLARGAGVDLTLPDTPDRAADSAPHLSLGKRRLYRRFLAEVRRGKRARMLLVAQPGAGKTILLDTAAQALPGSLRLRLEGEFAPALERLSAALELPAGLVPHWTGRLDPRAPFAVSGEIQRELSRQLVTALAASEAPALLLRAGTHGTLGGEPLRLPGGALASPAAWIWHHLLLPLAEQGLPILAALSDAQDLPADLGVYGEAQPLPRPSLADARKFVRAKLPHLPPPEVERVVRQSGRDYDVLSLLTLLAGVGAPGADSAADDTLPPLSDAALLDFLAALDVTFSAEYPEADLEFFGAVLGGPLEERRELERAFLEGAGEGRVRPTRPDLAPRLLARQGDAYPLRERQATFARRAVRAARTQGDPARALHHALRGELWDEVLDLPATGTALETAWQAAQTQAVPAEVAEVLARQLAAEYAQRGSYGHPAMQAALELLAASADADARAWAAVKRAEALIDGGHYAQAARQLAGPPGHDPLTCAERALSQAAVARWEGQLDLALSHLDKADAALQGARAGGDAAGAAATPAGRGAAALAVKARLWRALCSKDRGDWAAGLPLLRSLRADPDAAPLQQARAAYQLGDALSRLGQQGQAEAALSQAAHVLRASQAAPEEEARAWARLGTVRRRRGDLAGAEAALDQAAALAPDAFTLARIRSEAVPVYVAQGRYDRALAAGHQAWEVFARAGSERPSETLYRRLRAECRLALVYLARGVGQPYRPPFSGATHDCADLHHARTLLRGVQADIPPGTEERLTSLRLDTALALALSTPPGPEARAHAQAAVRGAAHPYQAAQAWLGLAETELRCGQPDAALAELNRAHLAARLSARLAGAAEWDEPALDTWLAALEFAATLDAAPALAWDGLNLALARPALQRFHPELAGWAAGGLSARGKHAQAARLGQHPLLTPADAAMLGCRPSTFSCPKETP
ncbi:hypothetical protein [Deinococcus sp. SL84]|uniref:hypothetical protein n=1 Tax=Deinococcus sp. SL84 TaxID=2994663 RepID=UPI00227333DF|nr:hypothetical protein [Deinococcus sp. SL84]MCY1702793.1 hypothetical protein [Deinococcus sp. SL84]